MAEDLFQIKNSTFVIMLTPNLKNFQNPETLYRKDMHYYSESLQHSISVKF